MTLAERKAYQRELIHHLIMAGAIADMLADEFPNLETELKSVARESKMSHKWMRRLGWYEN